jgi:hypothetical protein
MPKLVSAPEYMPLLERKRNRHKTNGFALIISGIFILTLTVLFYFIETDAVIEKAVSIIVMAVSSIFSIGFGIFYWNKLLLIK